MDITTEFPIMAIRQQPDGTFQAVLSPDGGVGQTATLKRTRRGWRLIEAVLWVR
jgi:hypothetical protein